MHTYTSSTTNLSRGRPLFFTFPNIIIKCLHVCLLFVFVHFYETWQAVYGCKHLSKGSVSTVWLLLSENQTKQR